MRCAVVSDIHANLQAWKAALIDIRSQGIDRIVCLGDVVGYGPNPAEVLESVHAHVDHLVLGNHDAVVCGKLDPALFNPAARQIVDWTRSRLSRRAGRFLETLPLTLAAPSFRCAHANFAAPGLFDYIDEAEDALASWRAVAEPLLFVGHSHRPAIFVLGSSGMPHKLEPEEFCIEEGKRYIVNAGSVGQPRDGEARACYCVLDTDEGSVRWRRIPFDLDAYRAALAEAGIPEESSYFLRADPLAGVPPLRELVQFAPSGTPHPMMRRTEEVQDIGVLKRRVRRWKALVATTAVALALVLAAGGALLRRHHRGGEIPGRDLTGTTARAGALERNLVAWPPFDGATSEPVGWTVRLGDRRRQTARQDAGAGDTVLSSDAPRDTLSLVSAPIRVSPGMKVRMAGMFLTEEGFDGEAALV